MTEPHAAVILLNWNGWKDTVECIDSLLKSEYPNFVIVVCDNASEDDSWEQIRSWCEANAHDGLQVWSPGMQWSGTSRLVLIQTGSNLGFAGGCNVGIRFALQQTRASFLWLLNSDTVVSSTALTSQVRRMQEDPSLGLLGSTIIYSDRPETVRCFGGYGFNFWTARVRPFSFLPDPKQPPSVADVEARIRYVSGASTFVSRDFLRRVGLLNEQYFLYFEEIDWAVRGRDFRISYCPESVVVHKEGRSIGSANVATKRSRQSELWLTRNRILFTRTYFPLRLPVAVLWVLLVAAVRLCTGKFAISATLLQGVCNGLKASVQAPPKAPDWPQGTSQADTPQRRHATANGHPH